MLEIPVHPNASHSRHALHLLAPLLSMEPDIHRMLADKGYA
jgi:hypothetical protein